jgi:hypothetical protein
MQGIDYTNIDARGHESLRRFPANDSDFPPQTRATRIRAASATLSVVARGSKVPRLKGIAAGKSPKGLDMAWTLLVH